MTRSDTSPQPLDRIAKVESFIVSIPREVPYLGPLRDGEFINEKGYLIRKGNRSIYPASDMSVLVKITGESGRIGWGETYGIAAPEAVTAIIDNLLAPVLVGRCPSEAMVIWEDLYDLMRVRGFFGGYYVDALAGVDIAVWDLYGKGANLSVAQLLGGARHRTLPAYVSGLPRATLQERCDLAQEWVAKGYRAIKFAAAVSDEGIVAEMAALREAVGAEVDLMVDLHWKFEASEAIRLIRRLEPYNLYFAEAPCQAEDIEGQARVAAGIGVPLALGEEWRTVYEVRPRLMAATCGILQPEIGHTGITQFARIGQMAQAFHKKLIPHASISMGLFMAASLQATAALQRVPYHEYQHSIFDRNLDFTDGDMGCEAGHYRIPTGPGLGVEPNDALLQHVRGLS
ncbi:mandelate racemase/muconate lactonizing enzyme family protein [Oceanomicrobium pacificus]|uniref:Mandelate racemase/muconate lactonizing enzyme family protein n=1 Tax=Oceanomicrobium pacificus TaxID=2692916 RepID=A0A6B0TQW8_9RHOB|nr:mandelate racemase/muconate lactonizing enzyme family protein [Oceanomicrobium pacificus]MXU65079.1 mandelate racemase/muconate lactonizing enzyme family protein [Oceanomicrobium pacificus]